MAFITSTAANVFGTANADTINTRSLRDGSFSTIYGGLGNDIYFIDAFSVNSLGVFTPEEIVIEALGGGIDTVSLDMLYDNATFAGNNNFTLSEHVENLEANLIVFGNGRRSFTLTGNSLANKITVLSNTNDTVTDAFASASLNGNAGNDTLIGGSFGDRLDGGSGADMMLGGAGDDRFYVDNVLDQVIESTDNGFDDRVYSSVTFTLGANIEQLYLEGNANINGTGNALNNILYGNAGNDTLNGLAGNDSIFGNSGNDVLSGGAGEDALRGENGNDVINGGAGDDTLIGGSGNDTLNGGAGNDTLYGNYAGNGFIDRLDGGAGDDFYAINNANDMVADTGVGGMTR